MSLQSARIKKVGKIVSTLQDARKNNEIISAGDSQLFRTLRKVSNHPYEESELLRLWNERTRLKKKKNKKENVSRMSELTSKIDEMLFVPEIVSITFNHVAHYKQFVKEGVWINGTKFVRFMGSAGQLRRSTVLFIQEQYLEKVREIIENGFNKEVPVNFGKFNAYYSLVSSSSIPVSTPNYVVIPDLEETRDTEVDFVEDDNETVNRKVLPIVHNLFDGAGIISMDFAKQWSFDLGLDYDACSFIFRAPWCKGLLTSFPFRTLAAELGVSEITDIYGDVHQIDNVDVVMTKSQFKLSEGYSSIAEHKTNSLENNLSWNVTRVNPNKDKKSFMSSYQYIQVLKDDVDIEKLCRPTLDYFNDVSILDGEKALIYLMGSDIEDDLKFNKIENPIVKALCLNKDVIQDPHIRKSIIKSLNRKIRDSYFGKLLISPGNYQFVLFDPYAIAQHAFGFEATGLLGAGEHYSQYWNNMGSNQVVAGRSPLTWRSEMLRLDFKNNQKMEKYFGHLYSGIVFNVHSPDMMCLADGDGDGDAVFTSDNDELLKNCYGGVPVTYNRKATTKNKISYDELSVFDAMSFNSKIGLVTNNSSTYYSMLSLFPEDSKEHQLILKRLVICRKQQGMEIDKTKGLLIDRLPEWNKKSDDPVHNNILTNRRPMWMNWLYPHRKKDYDSYNEMYDVYCYAKYGFGIDFLLKKEVVTEEQSKIIERHRKFCPVVVGSTSIMQRISDYMVSEVKELKVSVNNKEFDYSVYFDKSVGLNESIREPLRDLMKLYNKLKKNLFFSPDGEKSEIVEFIKNKAFEISSDLSELTNMALDINYGTGYSQSFVWEIFSDGILDAMKKKTRTFDFPVPKENGRISFAGRRFNMVKGGVDE
ncbi:MAG: hypothetical protein WA061_02185 [Microgenomates group bacterium]